MLSKEQIRHFITSTVIPHHRSLTRAESVSRIICKYFNAVYKVTLVFSCEKKKPTPRRIQFYFLTLLEFAFERFSFETLHTNCYQLSYFHFMKRVNEPYSRPEDTNSAHKRPEMINHSSSAMSRTNMEVTI